MQAAVSGLYHWDSTAAAGHRNGGIPQGLQGADLHDPLRCGRRYHPAPSPARILFHGVALFLSDPFCLLRTVEGADGLCWVLEGRVLLIHHHLRHHGDHRDVPAPPHQLCPKLLLQDISDKSLTHGITYIKGHNRRLLRRCFRGQNDPPHLRAVSMHHCHFIAAAADIRQYFCRPLHHHGLRLRSGRQIFILQRIAAQRHYDPRWPAHRVATKIALMACIRFSA